jgi:Trp operon repressor
MVILMTQDERDALTAERVELQRKHQKRKNVPGYAANAASLLDRIEVIDALLDAEPLPEPEA